MFIFLGSSGIPRFVYCMAFLGTTRMRDRPWVRPGFHPPLESSDVAIVGTPPPLCRIPVCKLLELAAGDVLPIHLKKRKTQWPINQFRHSVELVSWGVMDLVGGQISQPSRTPATSPTWRVRVRYGDNESIIRCCMVHIRQWVHQAAYYNWSVCLHVAFAFALLATATVAEVS